MKTKEKPHLIICNNHEIRNQLIQEHVDNQYGSISAFEDAVKDRDCGKRTKIFCLVKPLLSQMPAFKALTPVGQKSCLREMSRYLNRDAKSWIANNKNKVSTPPVNEDYKGLDKLFATNNPVSNEMNTIEKLVSMGAKTIKTPDGWEATF